MTDITPERIEDLRRQHHEHHRSDILSGKCTHCLDDYPCPVIALLDALEEARKPHHAFEEKAQSVEALLPSTCNVCDWANQMISSSSYFTQQAEQERDQLRQELEEARRQAEDCYGKEMCRGFRDSYWVVAGQRDQLRAELGLHQLDGKGQCPMCYTAGYEDAERELRAENERLRAALKDAKDALLWSTGGWRTEGISESELVPAREALRQSVRRIESALAASPEQEASQ